MNSDLYFENSVINLLLEKFEDTTVGLVSPRYLNPDGSIQVSAKLLPTPFNLFVRILIPFKFIRNFFLKKYELDRNRIISSLNVPVINGAFLLIRLSVFSEVEMFDKRYFLYLEDYDLVRRIHRKYKTLYVPDIVITHQHNAASKKSIIPFKYHCSSAIKYFNKYGWLFDKERKSINSKVLANLKFHKR